MDQLPVDIDAFCANESAFVNNLKSLDLWQRVPLLNHTPLHQVKDLALVRFRGMLQDMSDLEVYLERYEVRDTSSRESRIQNGKYRDCLSVGANEEPLLMSRQNKHGDRRTIFLVTIPGLNDWVCAHEQQSNQTVPNETAAIVSNGSGQKRALEDEPEAMEVDSSEKCTSKRICSGRLLSAAPSSLLSAEYLLNSPLKDRPSKACMVKLYTDFDKYALNSIIDVVGFLSVDPTLDGSSQQVDDFEDRAEIQAANPPPSLIPRLHAIAVRQLEHVNPLLDESLLPVADPVDPADAIHRDLLATLKQCLFGDGVAAEYLLSNLISNIFVRTDLQTLGQFSLNICGIPTSCLPSYTKELYEILEMLLPASYYFPMTLENMNTLQFVPKKDYKTNKLVSGLLQLAPQTHLILDETRMEPGKLEENGVRGVQSLADLISTQQLNVDFEYFQMKYDVNVPVLTLSEGRSMLPSDFQLPLKPDPDCIPIIDEALKAAKHYIQPKLNSIRRYLTLSKLNEFGIHHESTVLIEDYFVETRKKDVSFGPEQFNRMLLLSRLLATARGIKTLDRDTWELAKSLQSEQHERLNRLPKRK